MKAITPGWVFKSPDGQGWVAHVTDFGTTWHSTHAEAIEATCNRLKNYLDLAKKTPTNA